MRKYQSKYFDLISCENDRKDANYSLKIKWNVRNIADYDNANGFIVQKVELLDETKIIPNYVGPYFEAWKVENGLTQYRDYDDNFENGINDFADIVMFNSIDKSGKIEYRCKVFWVDESSPIYNSVSTWTSCVSMANGLPSILENECNLFVGHKIITKRFFCHIVDFKSDDTIKDHIEKTYKNRLLKKDRQLYTDILEKLSSTRLQSFAEELCLKYGIEGL